MPLYLPRHKQNFTKRRPVRPSEFKKASSNGEAPHGGVKPVAPQRERAQADLMREAAALPAATFAMTRFVSRWAAIGGKQSPKS